MVGVKEKVQSASAVCWRWARRIVIAGLFVIGLAGIPDDLTNWQGWINTSAESPIVLALAERAASIANFVDQFWFRTILVVCGILLIMWPASRFWRFRHHLLYRWRALLSGEVWIPEAEAHKLVATSDWGMVRAPFSGIADILSFGAAGPSPHQQKERKFRRYCYLVLDSFAEDNPTYVRVAAGGREFRQDKLSLFVQQALDRELLSEFGSVPSGEV